MAFEALTTRKRDRQAASRCRARLRTERTPQPEERPGSSLLLSQKAPVTRDLQPTPRSLRGDQVAKASKPKVFFAYPSQPEATREALSRACKLIRGTGLVATTSWEELRVSGHLIIDTVLSQVRESQLSIVDITHPNQNVMFELGFAIGQGTPIWLVRDPSWKGADRTYHAIKILTTVGHVEYTNSDEIQAAFLADQPHLVETSLYESAIAPNLQPIRGLNLLYLMSLYQDDAARAVTRRLAKESKRGWVVVAHDPAESAVEPLTWFAQQIYGAQFVVVHFTSPKRQDADIQNARYALVAGLALGMGKPILMLADDDYLAPVDYRDLLYVYRSSRACVECLDAWVSEQAADASREIRASERAAQIRLATELKNLRLGEHIAEHEVATLDHYFLETPAYFHVLKGTTTIFVGRKGSGKTANFFAAAQELENDPRVLACIIKPQSYELEGILRLLEKYSRRDSRHFIVESLWKLLLYTEIAAKAAEEIDSLAAGVVSPGSAEWELAQYVDANSALFKEDFALRFENAVRALQTLRVEDELGVERNRIGEALHGEMIPYLRRLLGRALGEKERVAVLIDNLDKAWGPGSDLGMLTHLLTGLMSAIRRVSQDFARDDAWRDPVNVTLAMFIRKDIFDYVYQLAQEPDKLPVTTIRWTDREMLLRVLEERYRATRDTDVEADELWDKYFCRTVTGVRTQEYLVRRSLPRPRDLVYFANAAIETAVGRGHVRIEEEDVLDAEEAYSQFAFEAIQVENGTGEESIEDILYEFAGCPSILEERDVMGHLERGGLGKERWNEVIDRLKELSFLGSETRDGEFEYSEDSPDPKKVEVLSRRLAANSGRDRRYQVHPAFRRYLEVVEIDER